MLFPSTIILDIKNGIYCFVLLMWDCDISDKKDSFNLLSKIPVKLLDVDFHHNTYLILFTMTGLTLEEF